MRSSAVLMIVAASVALAQEYNYTFPSGFNLGAVNPTMLGELIFLSFCHDPFVFG